MKSLSGKLGIVLIGFFIIGYGEVWGADWKFYGRTDKCSSFYDAKSISHPSENIVEVSVKQDYTKKGVDFMVKAKGEKYKNLNYTIALWQINCAEKKFRILSLIYYSKEKKVLSSWEVLQSSFGSSKEWKPFIIDSLGEGLFKTVCK